MFTFIVIATMISCFTFTYGCFTVTYKFACQRFILHALIYLWNYKIFCTIFIMGDVQIYSNIKFCVILTENTGPKNSL